MRDKIPSHYEVEGEPGSSVPFTTFKTAALDDLRRRVNELIEAVDQLEGTVEKLRNDVKQGDLWRLKAR